LIVNENARRIAWFRLNANGEPYAFGAHDDERGSLCGPWRFERGGIRHPLWVALADGSLRFMIQDLGVNVALDDALFSRPKEAPTAPATALTSAVLATRADLSAWQARAKAGFPLPGPDEPIDTLLDQLVSTVTDLDPVWRDDIGYTAFAKWVHRDARIGAPALRRIADRLMPIATSRDPGTDGVFGRSFAMLWLKEMVFADQRVKFLTDAELVELGGVASLALEHETDLRGYVAGRGWAHAVAHAADLARALAHHPRVTPASLRALHSALRARVGRNDGPFAWGEEARLAAALNAVALRDDMAARDAFKAVATRCRDVWRGAFDVVRYQVSRREAVVAAAMLAQDGARGVGLGDERLREVRHVAEACQ
jgi:hypothetical protein